MTGLDGLDRRIVAALQMDGRASWTEIGEACGASVATVARRAQALLAGGHVRVAVVPNVNHAGPADLLHVRVECSPGTQVRVAEELMRRDDVRLVALITGPFDVLAELTVRKDESLSARGSSASCRASTASGAARPT